MALSAKTLRTQLSLVRPLLVGRSLKSLRSGQQRLGELIEARLRSQVLVREHRFDRFIGSWVMPRDERRQGVLLYLHGGGYACGDRHYASGIGAFLSVTTGAKVFCPAYRLAPEHPFPAALEDALESYRYLLSKGYAPGHITLCGESAGGGLCYSLCLRLQEESLPLPGSIIAISPWTDLTASGPSYGENIEKDPTMTAQALDFYAESYTQNREDPLVSPLFAPLTNMPPSLIFAARNEIMYSDAQLLSQKLTENGCSCTFISKDDRWHAYVLYGLKEDQEDLRVLNRFLDQHLAREHKLRWLRLDNAAKIYPAARRNNWSNIYRLSATLTEPIDADKMQLALDVTVRRFPSIAARLRRGLFWYYLQQLDRAPVLRTEHGYPLTRMSRQEMRKCAFRVIVYENRVAVELFHSLTDGNGALVFLKSLIAEYLLQKYDLHIPADKGVVGRLEYPSDEEMEDSFQKYGGTVNASRRSNNAWRIHGTPEKDGFLNLTCFRLPVQSVVEKAHEYGVTVTTFLCACLMMALQKLQQEIEPNQLRRKSIKVLMPVNLRKLFPSKTLRNFAMYSTPEIQPRLGWYEFEEICQLIRHRMGLDITPKHMSTMIAANIRMEKVLAVRMVPLFVKNLVMKFIFDSVGERKSCITLSNLGQVDIPDAMRPYVQRFDLILGIQATAPHNCGVIAYGDHLYMNFIRNIRESDLERHFYQVLKEMGIPVQIQSNLAERS